MALSFWDIATIHKRDDQKILIFCLVYENLRNYNGMRTFLVG